MVNLESVYVFFFGHGPIRCRLRWACRRDTLGQGLWEGVGREVLGVVVVGIGWFERVVGSLESEDSKYVIYMAISLLKDGLIGGLKRLDSLQRDLDLTHVDAQKTEISKKEKRSHFS